MSRIDHRRMWEYLLEEPVEAVVKTRLVEGSGNTTGPLKFGSVLLTKTRFILIRGRFAGRRPRSTRELAGDIVLQFPRINITEIEPVAGSRKSFDVRWFEEKEKRVRLRSDGEWSGIMTLLQRDITGI